MKPSDVPVGPLILDTDVLSYITWRQKRYAEFSALIGGHLLALAFVTVGEIRARTFKTGSTWSEERRGELNEKLRSYVILTATDDATTLYAQLHSRFLDRIGTNDLWIAACALAQPQAVPIVTNNLSHFQLVAGEFPKLAVIHPDL